MLALAKRPEALSSLTHVQIGARNYRDRHSLMVAI
jgi:hypothetical protein